MRQQMIESEVVIEGEFASVETMQEWGFTEFLGGMKGFS